MGDLASTRLACHRVPVSSDDRPEVTQEVLALARAHGLELGPASLRIHEAGLDYRVAIGRAADGAAWVLRIPRRPDVSAKIGAEAAILDLVRPALSVAVPDWRIQTAALLAYPLLPGEPGLIVDGETGALHWRLDMTSRRYAIAFGQLLAELHRIDLADACAAGIERETPAEVRARWRADIAAVQAEFAIAGHLQQRWSAWLDDDSYWPTWSVFTHGELYPAHVLVDADDAITGVLDWTTAKVSDPARDFVYQHAMTSPEIFALSVDSYVQAGGRVWPRLAEHCAELWTAAPVAYGLYAILTGDPTHRAAAAAQLNPPPP